jgi:hypothetical protein
MNYNYILSTGAADISGSQYDIDERNNVASIGDKYYVDASVVTGRLSSMASLNSQTLLEDEPTAYTGVNQTIYNIDSGDYYFDFENIQNRGKVYTDDAISVDNNSTMLYDVVDPYTGVVSVWTGGDPTGALGELVNSLVDRGELSGGSTISGDLFTGWNVFANGQKLANYDEASGLALTATGKFFGIKKPLKILEIDQQDNPDVYGQKFIPNQVDFYINGMEQKESSFLQTYTGVNLIATGLEAITPINQPENSSYSL